MQFSSRIHFIFRKFASTLFLLLVVSCASPQINKPMTLQEVARLNQSIGRKLAKKFEKQIQMRGDSELNHYLHKILNRLEDGSPQLKNPIKSPTEIFQIRSPHQKWKAYALPGGRIYLPIEIFSSLQSESEIAALLAIQLSYLDRKIIVNHLNEDFDFARSKHTDLAALDSFDSSQWIDKVEFLNEGGLFFYSDTEEEESFLQGVEIMYRGGYDPRGMMALLETHKNMKKHSPYSIEKINRFKEKVRRKISFYPPLLNPIVRTHEFVRMQKRMNSL